jgi:hypothetical protein
MDKTHLVEDGKIKRQPRVTAALQSEDEGRVIYLNSYRAESTDEAAVYCRIIWGRAEMSPRYDLRSDVELVRSPIHTYYFVYILGNASRYNISGGPFT